MCHCNQNSCCSDKGCGCGCQSKSCCGGSQKSCGCKGCGSDCGCKSQGCGSQQCGSYASKFLELADCAWMEVLKEKIKDHIRANAKHMDELAALISEANHEKWQKKMENQKCCGGFEEKLGEMLGSCCQVKGQPSGSQGSQNKNVKK